MRKEQISGKLHVESEKPLDNSIDEFYSDKLNQNGTDKYQKEVNNKTEIE